MKDILNFKPWPWHVEAIPEVSVVGLVTNEELCKVVCGIIIKNFLREYSLRERERTRTRKLYFPRIIV